MSNLGSKRLPTAKTVVFEFSVQLADILARNVRMKGSAASQLLDSQAFNNGDVNVDNANPYLINGVKSIVVLQSFDPFHVSITDVAGTQITIECNGLFVHQGAISQISIVPNPNYPVIRLQYLWS